MLFGYVKMGCGVVAGEEGGLARAGTGDEAGGNPPLAPCNSQLWFSKQADRKANMKQTSRPISSGGSQDGFALVYSERGISLAQHQRGVRQRAQRRPLMDLHLMRAACIPGSSC